MYFGCDLGNVKLLNNTTHLKFDTFATTPPTKKTTFKTCNSAVLQIVSMFYIIIFLQPDYPMDNIPPLQIYFYFRLYLYKG